MQENHSFDPLLACEVGIEKALILKEIHYWIKVNTYNKRNFYENKVWTYNSSKAWCKYFPYFKERSLRKWLQELEKDGWIITGKFNKTKYDQTKWYSLGDKYFKWENKKKEKLDLKKEWLAFTKEDSTNNDIKHDVESIGTNCQWSGRKDQYIGKNCQPIPTLKPNSKNHHHDDDDFLKEKKELVANEDKTFKDLKKWLENWPEKIIDPQRYAKKIFTKYPNKII